MCNRCDERAIDRRSLLALAGFGAAAVSLGLDVRSVVAAEGKKSALTPDQALAALKEGNARYVSSPQACVMDLAKRRADVATSQAPWANFVPAMTSVTTPVATAPTPLITAERRQPDPRSFRQCTTMPAWDRVKLVKTPTA